MMMTTMTMQSRVRMRLSATTAMSRQKPSSLEQSRGEHLFFDDGTRHWSLVVGRWSFVFLCHGGDETRSEVVAKKSPLDLAESSERNMALKCHSVQRSALGVRLMSRLARHLAQ